MRTPPLHIPCLLLIVVLFACGGEKSHLADAVDERDSVAFMTAHGVSNLISDSGLVRYKMLAEEWLIYNATEQRGSRWDFLKGFFMQKYDPEWHVEWYISSDTAYCHHDDLWELRGRVLLRNREGTTFRTEELFWDMGHHEVYSSKFIHIKEPERELQGYNFRSNEEMTQYTIYNSSGMLPVEAMEGAPADSTAADSTGQAREADKTPDGVRGTRETDKTPDDAVKRSIPVNIQSRPQGKSIPVNIQNNPQGKGRPVST